jgi:DNA-binding CsgD family transcriptional regulator/tetratricopeptide (TPR) repeat protein
MLATYRSDEVGGPGSLAALLPLLVRESGTARVDLQRLDVTALAALIARRYALPASHRERLVRYVDLRAEGNPFFANELLRTLEQRGALQPSGSGWRLGDIQHVQVPPLVRQVIDGRLAHLDAETRSALEVAAVIGQTIPLDLWSRVTGLADEQLDAVASQAIGASLLEETSDARGWRFSHALVRDACYERLMLPRRRQWHGRIAEALRATDESDAAALAYHFDQAGDPCAVEWHLRAGDRAQRLYALQTAVTHYTAALETGSTTVEQRLQARRSRGRAFETIGEFERAEDDFEAAIALARQMLDRPAELQTCLDLGLLWASRNYDRAGEHCQRALQLARMHDDRSILAHARNRVGNWYGNGDHGDVAMLHHQEALALFEQLDDRHGVAATLDLLGMAAHFIGDTPAAAHYCEQAVALARELGERKLLSSALATLAVAQAPIELSVRVPPSDARGDWRGNCAEALAVSREMGWRAGEAFALAMLGMLQTCAGRYEQVLRIAAEIESIATDIGHVFWLSGAHETVATVHHLLLDLDRAQASTERALHLASDVRSGQSVRSITASLALMAIESGDLERARTLLHPVTGIADTLTSSLSQRSCWAAQAALSLARSEPAQALDLLDQLVDATPHMTTERISPQVARLRAAALLALGRSREAEEQLLAGCTVAATFGYPGQLWRLRLDLGRLYLTQGRSEEARRELRAARETIDELARHTPSGELREGFLRRASALFPAPEPASAPTSARLSPRETEVLALLVQGATDQEIADALSIRHRTVTTHVTNIFNKLGVNTRTAAANLAIRRGMV